LDFDNGGQIVWLWLVRRTTMAGGTRPV